MIRYFANRQITIEDLLPLYQSVSWTNYTERSDMLEQAFQHSLFTVSAYDGEQLVGLLRAVGDGFSSVFIQDLLVFFVLSAPRYRSRIGSTNAGDICRCLSDSASNRAVRQKFSLLSLFRISGTVGFELHGFDL